MSHLLSNIETGQILIGVALGVIVTLTYHAKFVSALSRLSGASNLVNPADSKGYVKMILVVRKDLGMKPGKIAAQCSHAAVGCYRIAQKTRSRYLDLWEMYGQPKIVVKCDKPGEEALQELAAKAKRIGVTNVIIHDAGHTQVASGTATVLGLGPATNELIDSISGHLKLL